LRDRNRICTHLLAEYSAAPPKVIMNQSMPATKALLLLPGSNDSLAAEQSHVHVMQCNNLGSHFKVIGGAAGTFQAFLTSGVFRDLTVCVKSEERHWHCVQMCDIS
jgi:hypothetical protein